MSSRILESLILFKSIQMMVKDDYDLFCNVADRAASVKFQEMHLFFSKTPDPMSESYFITIQVSLFDCDAVSVVS